MGKPRPFSEPVSSSDNNHDARVLGRIKWAAWASCVLRCPVHGQFPACFVSISGWRVPDKQPSVQQGARQAQSGADKAPCCIFHVELPGRLLSGRKAGTAEGHSEALPHPSETRQLSLAFLLHQAEPSCPDSCQGLTSATTHRVSQWQKQTNKQKPKQTNKNIAT